MLQDYPQRLKNRVLMGDRFTHTHTHTPAQGDRSISPRRVSVLSKRLPPHSCLRLIGRAGAVCVDFADERRGTGLGSDVDSGDGPRHHHRGYSRQVGRQKERRIEGGKEGGKEG